ncbi:MAG: acetolactate synthase [Candidatus Spyradosoma sp.]
MPKSVSRSRIKKNIFQFSVFAENKVGCLNVVTQALVSIDVHLLGMSCLDQTDCAVVRFVPNYAESAEKALKKAKIAYSRTRVVVAELATPEDLTKITQALGQAEINIHYLYPLFCRPEGRCGLVLSTNDLDLTESVLSGYGIRVLDLDDLAR